MTSTYAGLYRLRWGVLARDNFTCQYCGQKAPQVMLEVDHIVPKSKGGGDEEDNLVASCVACNRGKRDLLGMVNPRAKKVRPVMRDMILSFLREKGPASATEVARAIEYNRANVSRALQDTNYFMKVRKHSKSVLYAPASLLSP